MPVVEKINEHNETTLQTDYNGKNEESYVNCRITKFDSEGKSHLVGISKILEKHREFFSRETNITNIDGDVGRLCDNMYKGDDITDEKRNKFVEYFKKDPPPEKNLREYFKTAGEVCGLTIIEGKDFNEIITNYGTILKYQAAFNRNKEKIIGKQKNIADKVQIQGQKREK